MPDTVAPAFVSAAANGASLTITFDEALAAASPPNSAFTVKKTPAGGAETPVTLAASPSIAGQTVTLTLSEALAHDDGDVKVSYAASGLGASDRLADGAGNAVADFTDRPVSNDTVDTVAPAFVSAAANGASLTITFDEALATASPPNSAFTVKKTPAGGAETTVTLAATPSIAGRTVTLTLSEALAHDDGDVKVSYAASGLGASDRLADGAGNAVADFTDRPVSNVTGDTVAPAFVSAAANGASLTIAFDEDLAAASPPNSAFTVKKTPAGGAETTVTLAATPSIAGRTVTLTLSEALAPDDGDVKVSYAAPGPGDGDVLADAAGNAVADFTDRPVSNDTVDTVAPAFVSAAANGASLTITFDEELAAASPPNSAFTVKKTPAGGAETTATLAAAPAVDGRTVTLTLSEALAHDDGDVKVSYAAPGPGDGDVLADGAGNAVADFTDRPVSNETPDTVAPAFVSATANGASLTITFDEALAAATPPNSAFTVKKTPAGGDETTVPLAAAPAIDGRTLTLTLSTALAPDDGDVKVSYAAPAPGDGDRLAGRDGNLVADFTDRPVSNETSAAFVSAAANGASLAITFDEELAPATPPSSAFTVKKTPAGGAETTVPLADGPSIDGRTLTLTLSTALAPDDGDVKVSYAAPAPGAGDRLAYHDGDAVADFTDRPVSNETPSAAPPPTPRAAPTAWTARFGRTVALQAIDAVAARLAPPGAAGLSGRVAGQRIAGAAPARIPRPNPAWATARPGGDARDANPRFLRSRTPTGREVLGASSLTLTGGTTERGSATLWGRGAVTRFEGGDDQRGVDGDVTSAMLGADFAHGMVLGGLAFSYSRGTGGYRSGSDRNRAESTLTAFLPYGRIALSDRVWLWGMAGYGAGRLSVTPPGRAALRPRLDLVMGAAGLHGVLLDGDAGGVLLTAKSDAMAVRTRTDAASGPEGGLAASESDVTRLRLALEGSRPFAIRRTAVLTPSLEFGARHDHGDAETGFGADIAAGVALTDTALGLSAEFRARGLLTHEDAGMEEIGISGSLFFDPAPASDRGLSLRIAQAVGGEASSGADALLARPTLAGLEAEEADPGHRLEARLGYGLPVFGERWTGTPELGLELSDAGRDYRLGWRLSRKAVAGQRFDLQLEGTRHEDAGAGGRPRYGLGLGLGWRLDARRAGGAGFDLRLEAARRDVGHGGREPEHLITLRATAGR